MATVLTNDGMSLSYRILGSGLTTVLFMHGWAGSGSYFDEVIAELDLNAVRIVTMDLRGHGESDKTVKPYDIDRIAADVWTVAEAVGAANLVLVGFSMSGKFAQYVAVCQPRRVIGMVVVAGPSAAEMSFPQEVARDWVARAGHRERIREVLTPFISEPVDPTVFNRFLDNAVKVPANVLDCTLQTCIRASFIDRIDSLTMPTLIVGGRRDPIVSPEVIAQLARDLPRARGICLDCSHEIPMERPRELAHAIEAFVCGLGVGCRALAGVS